MSRKRTPKPRTRKIVLKFPAQPPDTTETPTQPEPPLDSTIVPHQEVSLLGEIGRLYDNVQVLLSQFRHMPSLVVIGVLQRAIHEQNMNLDANARRIRALEQAKAAGEAPGAPQAP